MTDEVVELKDEAAERLLRALSESGDLERLARQFARVEAELAKAKTLAELGVPSAAIEDLWDLYL